MLSWWNTHGYPCPPNNANWYIMQKEYFMLIASHYFDRTRQFMPQEGGHNKYAVTIVALVA